MKIRVIGQTLTDVPTSREYDSLDDLFRRFAFRLGLDKKTQRVIRKTLETGGEWTKRIGLRTFVIQRYDHGEELEAST